jgi:hypothetical protein
VESAAADVPSCPAAPAALPSPATLQLDTALPIHPLRQLEASSAYIQPPLQLDAGKPPTSELVASSARKEKLVASSVWRSPWIPDGWWVPDVHGDGGRFLPDRLAGIGGDGD